MRKQFEKFENWNNHLAFMDQAFDLLEKGNNLTVLEYGMGDGSTPFLSDYCKEKDHDLFSYDNSKVWADSFRKFESKKHRIAVVESWHEISLYWQSRKPDLVLIDHAPGERRWEDVAMLMDSAKIIIIHDTEPAATGYMMWPFLNSFKFRKDYRTNGAWASMCSNLISF
jgi:hypothetical protein